MYVLIFIIYTHLKALYTLSIDCLTEGSSRAKNFFYREKIINNIKYNIRRCHPDQDYLQRPRVQYNNINNHLLGGRVQLPSLLFASLARGLLCNKAMNSIWIGAIPDKLSTWIRPEKTAFLADARGLAFQHQRLRLKGAV